MVRFIVTSSAARLRDEASGAARHGQRQRRSPARVGVLTWSGGVTSILDRGQFFSVF